MTFHGGYKEQILFDFWDTKTIPCKFLILEIENKNKILK
jgi:hypothetical protein